MSSVVVVFRRGTRGLSYAVDNTHNAVLTKVGANQNEKPDNPELLSYRATLRESQQRAFDKPTISSAYCFSWRVVCLGHVDQTL